MTHAALSAGCFFLAFSPTLALFVTTVYKKAQLVILVTTSAFFYLLSATASSFVWWCFKIVGLGGTAVAALVPSVLFQFLFRCSLVALYHKVERVIQQSLEKEDGENNNNNNNETTASNNGGVDYSEAARLRLELNDATSAIAAATGFGGMHAFLLYGTLLASEITNNVGVLYQDSCPYVPSLAVSAVNANLFGILQVFWMLLTFFGMRRRLIFGRGETAAVEGTPLLDGSNTARRRRQWPLGAWLGNSRTGGNLALLTCLVSHGAAAAASTVNVFDKGCVVSLPLIGGIVLVTAYVFWAGCSRIYMPSSLSTSLREGTASAAHLD